MLSEFVLREGEDRIPIADGYGQRAGQRSPAVSRSNADGQDAPYGEVPVNLLAVS